MHAHWIRLAKVLFTATLLLVTTDLHAEEVLGTGTARIVAGNQIAARSRALVSARKAAISAMVSKLADPARIATIGAMLEQGVLSQHARVIRRYRVVAERTVGDQQVEIEIIADVDRAAVARLLAGPSRPSSQPVARFGLALVGAKDRASELVSERVKAKLVASGVPLSQSEAQARVRLALDCRFVVQPKIRGLDWPARSLSCQASLHLADGTSSASRLLAFGIARRPSESVEALALQQMLIELQPLIAQAQTAATAPRLPIAGARLDLVGDGALSNYFVICQELVRGGLVARCAPNSMSAEQVALALGGAQLDAKAIVDALLRRPLSSRFQLERVSERTLRVRRVTEEAADGA